MTTTTKHVLGAFMAGALGSFVLLGVLVLLLLPSPPPPKVYPNGTAQMVMVRGARWGVLFGKEDDFLDMVGLYGITDCVHKRISIRGSLNIANQRDSVLHELLHAGTCDEAGKPHNRFYNSDDEADHAGIYKIANYMSELLHENPELATYFSGETK